jgi:hypothetical protein
VLLSKDLERTRIYSPHVRTITIESECTFVNPDVLLEGLVSDHYLLPNLASILHWVLDPSNASEAYGALRCFLSPKLHSLQMEMNQWEPAGHGFPELIDSIAYTSSAVREMTVYGPDENSYIPAFSNIFQKVFHSLSNLRSLTLSIKVFAYIADFVPVLPQLRRLCLLFHADEVPDDTDGNPTPSAGYAVLLPSLRILHAAVHTGDIPFWNTFLPDVGQRLEELGISLSEDLPTPQSRYQAVVLVANSCPNLRALGISNQDGMRGPLPADSASLYWVLKPLLRCSRLEIVDIPNLLESHTSYFLTDSDLDSMASAWPELTELYLASLIEGRRDGALQPKLSMNIITVLSARCLQLHSLTLTLDTSTCPNIVPDAAYPSTPLESINFGASGLDDPWKIALWLDTTCPALCDINSAWIRDENDARSAFWRRVCNIVRLLKRIPHPERQTADDLDRLKANAEEWLDAREAAYSERMRR